jgi:hypothetical protein
MEYCIGDLIGQGVRLDQEIIFLNKNVSIYILFYLSLKYLTRHKIVANVKKNNREG